jgi:hypothetical protein
VHSGSRRLTQVLGIMNQVFLRNLKLAIAVSLVCLWCFLTVTQALRGFSGLLFVAAILQWPARQFTAPLVWRWREGIRSILLLTAIFGCFWLLSRIFSEEVLNEFMRNPLVVFILWVLCMWGLVRQATSLAQVDA